ncbi:MAG: hypothetical protein ACO1OF_00705 [Adhaeribacter sp.]
MINDKEYSAAITEKPKEATVGLDDFKLLPYYEQLDYLITDGTYLATRYCGIYRINTYYLSTFFAEVWYDNKSNEVAGIRAFTSKE